jgi:hypothetical protein
MQKTEQRDDLSDWYLQLNRTGHKIHLDNSWTGSSGHPRVVDREVTGGFSQIGKSWS